MRCGEGLYTFSPLAYPKIAKYRVKIFNEPAQPPKWCYVPPYPLPTPVLPINILYSGEEEILCPTRHEIFKILQDDDVILLVVRASKKKYKKIERKKCGNVTLSRIF